MSESVAFYVVLRHLVGDVYEIAAIKQKDEIQNGDFTLAPLFCSEADFPVLEERLLLLPGVLLNEYDKTKLREVCDK